MGGCGHRTFQRVISCCLPVFCICQYGSIVNAPSVCSAAFVPTNQRVSAGGRALTSVTPHSFTDVNYSDKHSRIM